MPLGLFFVALFFCTTWYFDFGIPTQNILQLSAKLQSVGTYGVLTVDFSGNIAEPPYFEYTSANQNLFKLTEVSQKSNSILAPKFVCIGQLRETAQLQPMAKVLTMPEQIVINSLPLFGEFGFAHLRNCLVIELGTQLSWKR